MAKCRETLQDPFVLDVIDEQGEPMTLFVAEDILTCLTADRSLTLAAQLRFVVQPQPRAGGLREQV